MPTPRKPIDPLTRLRAVEVAIGRLIRRRPAAAGGGADTPATSVTDETAFGLLPDVGSGTDYARDDHTHGSEPHDAHASLTGVTATQHHTNVNDPATGEKAALAGNSGAPGSGNKYVTEAGLVTGVSTAEAYADAADAAHVAAGDPHTGYQRESEKGAVSGYASLDGGGTVPDAQLPAAIARDSEVTSAVSTHAGAADPHADRAFDTAAIATHAALPTVHHTNANDPASGEKAALAGTSGTPGPGNKYVTDADPRNTDARTPAAHAPSHLVAGGDPVTITHAQTTGQTATDHHAAPAAGPDADSTIDSAGAAGTASTFARSGHGHKVPSTAGPGAVATVDAAGAAGATGALARAAHGHEVDTSAANPAALGAAAPGATGAIARSQHVHPTTGLALDPHTFAQHTDRTMAVALEARRGTADGGTLSSLGTAPDIFATILLADAATQGATYAFDMPDDAVAAQPLNLVIKWAPATTDATPHAVRWSVDALKTAVGSSVGAAGTTTAFTGASAARTAGNRVDEAATQILASVSAGDTIRVDVRRVGADAADTYVGGVHILSLRFQYTADS